MERQIRDTFRWSLLVIWVAAAVILIGLVPQLRADVNGGWVQTNGPYGGEILAIHETPKGVLFAGTSGGGIFRSTDRGDTWAPVNTGLRFEPGEGLSVRAFAQKGGLLYAGTTDALYASTNRGDTWHQVPIFGKRFVSVSDIMFVGARVYVGTLNRGVWYSDDRDSWQPVITTIGDRMYTATLNSGVRYSDDDGDSWRPVLPPARLDAMLVRKLSSIGTTLVAATQNGVFRQRTNEDTLTAIDDDSVEQRINAFAAMDNLLYASGSMGKEGSGLFRSDDEGDSWTRIATEEITRTVETIAVYGTRLYAGTSGSGVFRSNDKGDSWTSINDGLDEASATSIGTDGTKLYAGTFTGVFGWIEGEERWESIGSLPHQILSLAVLDGFLYAGTAYSGVYKIQIAE